MSERDDYPPGVPCWVDTLQPDPETAMAFYGDLFGWEFKGPGGMPGNPPGRYSVAQLRGRDVAGVGSQPPGSPPPAWTTYIRVESADDAATKARGAGGRVVVEPFDALSAGRLAVLADPAGALFCLWEARERKGAQRVNEAAAWAMSQLSTPDPESAKAFYGEVFGWVAQPVQLGEATITLLRRPGYVGGEPLQPVPRDVVAVMTQRSGGRLPENAAAHWSVDFWVEDADATAHQAAKLGGKVMAPPFDTPVSRTAVLADPQGAVFSVSQVLKKELQLPKPVAAYVQAINARDADALPSSFAQDAVVTDVGREFRGLPAIKEWADHEIFAVDVTLAVVAAVERDGQTIVTVKIDGTFDRTGLPDPLLMDLCFTVANDKITALTCRLAGN
jgi:predicted enzyme related to lactoylglutathione lyase